MCTLREIKELKLFISIRKSIGIIMCIPGVSERHVILLISLFFSGLSKGSHFIGKSWTVML